MDTPAPDAKHLGLPLTTARLLYPFPAQEEKKLKEIARILLGLPGQPLAAYFHNPFAPPPLPPALRVAGHDLHVLTEPEHVTAALAHTEAEETLLFPLAGFSLEELGIRMKKARKWWKLTPPGYAHEFVGIEGLSGPFVFHGPSHESLAVYGPREQLEPLSQALEPLLGPQSQG
ncbi:MAG: hypothetical protein D6E12_09235 [Desulfovibrio sp.]|nr:MAG: hypothetical protein D6E12_09235 [Desulfovibrio sp.]